MAERRMFAKSVIDSDDFMNLPFSAQAFYTHLAMRADDDGLIGNAKSILRMVGAKEEDFNLLVKQGYIRIFESSVVAIVHWKIHNYIQKDRYKPSVYTEERAIMYPEKEKENPTEPEQESSESAKQESSESAKQESNESAKQERSESANQENNESAKQERSESAKQENKQKTEDIFSVSDLDTQDRLGKDRIGKDSTDKDRSDKDSTDKAGTAAKKPRAEIRENPLQTKRGWAMGTNPAEQGKAVSENYAERGSPVDTSSYGVCSDECEKVISLYNRICTSLVQVRSLSNSRRHNIKLLLNKYSLKQIEETFTLAQGCDFLCGKGERGWMASFDWLIREDNFIRVLEGHYESKQKLGESVCSYDLGDYERKSTSWLDGLPVE